MWIPESRWGGWACSFSFLSPEQHVQRGDRLCLCCCGHANPAVGISHVFLYRGPKVWHFQWSKKLLHLVPWEKNISASYWVIGAPERIRAHVPPAQQGDSGQRLRVHNRNKHRMLLGANKRRRAIDGRMGFCSRPSGRKKTRNLKWAMPRTEVNCVQLSGQKS